MTPQVNLLASEPEPITVQGLMLRAELYVDAQLRWELDGNLRFKKVDDPRLKAREALFQYASQLAAPAPRETCT